MTLSLSLRSLASGLPCVELISANEQISLRDRARILVRDREADSPDTYSATCSYDMWRATDVARLFERPDRHTAGALAA